MSDATAIALLRRELELEKRLSVLERENSIAFFQPHAKQEQFFAAAKFRRRYARTGNRFGKSEMGACEDIAFALGYRPWYPEGHPLRSLGIPPHPTKGIIVSADWEKTEEVFTSYDKEDEGPFAGMVKGKLMRYIPKRCLGQPTKNHSGVICHIPVLHISGSWSHIHLDTVKSFKQNPLGFESSSWDWAHIDEPCPEQMYKAIARGLVDRDGSAWFTCTPLTEPWIDSKFIPNLEDLSADSVDASDGDHWMMTGSMHDNPHNTERAIKLFLSELTDEERECRINGIPASYAGLVYKEFRWAEHVMSHVPLGWIDWQTPPPSYCIRIAIDYHFRKNDAVLFLAVSPEGYIYVYHELWEQLLVQDEVRRIKEILANREYMPVLVDPLAETPNKVTDLSAMEEYQRCGLAVLPATKDPVNGIRSVKALLKARDKHGFPILRVNPACRRFLFEISRGFIWDEDQNKPVKKNDDMMENFYRLVLQGLEYVEPSSDEDYAPSHRRDPGSTYVDPFEFLEPDARSRSRDLSRYRN